MVFGLAVVCLKLLVDLRSPVGRLRLIWDELLPAAAKAIGLRFLNHEQVPKIPLAISHSVPQGRCNGALGNLKCITTVECQP